MIRLSALIYAVALCSGTLSAQQVAKPDATAPTAIYDRLGSLKMGELPLLPKAERTAWDRWYTLRTTANKNAEAATDDELLDAALFASGVTDADRLAAYRKAFAELMAGAMKATAAADDDLARGEALMTFLHAGAMVKGYEEVQSSLAAVFDANKFNCVSSSVLYYLVATRLGLKLEGISIAGSRFQSGHACLDLIHGKKRIDLEPTNADGFHWSEKLRQPGVRVVGFQPDRTKGVRVDGPSLVALIAANRAVDAGKATPPRPLEAIRAQLIVLALDPANEDARKYLVGTFVNWGPRLLEADRFEEALRVMHFGRTLSANDDALENNLNVAYSTLVRKHLAAGRDADVAETLSRAAEAFPKDKLFLDPLHWYDNEAQARSKDDWEAGANLFDRALKTFPKQSAPIRDARASHARRWSQKLLDEDDVNGSFRVLLAADKLQPNDEEIRKGIDFHVQNAFRILSLERPKLSIHYKAMKAAFPKNAWIDEQGDRYARKLLADLSDAKKFADALTMTETLKVFLGEAKNADGLKADVYIRWSRHLADTEHPQAGLDKCSEGLRLLKGRTDLADAQIRIIDRWAEKLMEQKDWGEALCIYGYGLGYAPGNRRFENNMAYCLQEANRK